MLTCGLSALPKSLHLLYADEVNVRPDDSEFFVYGGISISGDRAGQLSADIEELRTKFGYRPKDILKFNTKERPKHIKPEAHLEIKREVMKAARAPRTEAICLVHPTQYC